MPAGQQAAPLNPRASHIMRRRRQTRWLLGATMALALVAIVAARMGSSSTDHDRFHQRWFQVVDAPGPDVLQLADPPRQSILARLIGVDANGNDTAHRRIEQLLGQEVMLYLEQAPTRNHAGELMAYAYLRDGTLLNSRLIEDGLAFADRRWDYSFARLFFQLEEQARTRSRGFWPGMTEPEMPEWRQRWLVEMRKQPWERGQWVRDDEP